MLGVEHHLLGVTAGLAQRIRDHGQVLAAAHAEGTLGLPGGTLADQRDHGRARLEQRHEARIVGGTAARAAGHAEGAQPRLFQLWWIREKRVVGRVGTGPAALDIVDPERVELPRDPELVSDREVDTLGLRPVAQRGVVEPDPLTGHARRQSVVPSGAVLKDDA